MPSERPSFIAELRRRHVVRVAIVYSAVAFVVLQAADLVFPRLGLPDWTVTFVVLLAALGLPMALVLAWAFEITPDGVQRALPAAAAPASAAPAWLSARTIATVVVALSLAVSVGWFAAHNSTADPVRRSIAVLPFVNMSGNAEDHYFSDGLAEEMLNLLARVEGLKVAARTSSFAFRNKDMDMREVGAQLDVATVLEGSVRRDRNRIRVTVQLIDAADGYHLWSETYDAELSDVFRVQEDMARAIVAALRIRLGAPADITVARPTVGAHDLYLLGLDRFHKREIPQAVDYFQRAVAEDSTYAQAWSGLAISYAVWAAYDTVTPARTGLISKQMAERAIALDDRLAEPYGAICQSMAYAEYRWREAEQVCDAAIARNHNSPIAHQWRAELDLIQRRYARADSGFARAAALDPLGPVIRLLACMSLMYANDLDRAETCFRDVRDIDRFGNAAGMLLTIHVLRNDLRALQALMASGDPDGGAQVAKLIMDARNDPALRSAAIATLEGSPPPGGEPIRWGFAVTRALVGDESGALRLLEASAARREFNLPIVIGQPVFEPLRQHPRFTAIMRQMGLEPYPPPP
jgi:TolB-like protein